MGTEQLAKAIRKESSGRQTFEGPLNQNTAQHRGYSLSPGYKPVNSIRKTHEQESRYFLADIRKGSGQRKSLNELRLVIAIFGHFVIQKDEGEPQYEEITIPTKLRKWTPSMSKMGGFLLPDQEMRNRFSFALAKGWHGKPPTMPFVIDEIRKKPWMPSQEAHLRAPGSWKALRKSRKRPSGMEFSFQSWAAYIPRFIPSGDICSSCDTIGGLAAQLAHFGTVLNLAVTENATIDQTYDNRLRA